MPAEAGTPNITRRRWLTHYAPLVFWVVVILGLGSSMGSMNETSRFIRPLLEFLFPTASPETLASFHGLIRKFAHFAEYAVLGFLAFRAFQDILVHRLKPALFAFILAAAVAAVDEFQQSFNPARTSSSVDVLIDLAGAAAAITFYALGSQRPKSSNNAKTSEP